ncbi:CmcI family methyltransferase [Streptomyces sviceus]|uniref:CmcI family methyltransferase n=1 Tax=Streptomyces TaxID=1883 RepID=UPI00368EF539
MTDVQTWEDRLPARVVADYEASLASYWHDRCEQHLRDWYMGVIINKYPEDLRVYEHLLWHARPNVVVEIGCSSGGSTLWFRDRLKTLAGYGRISDPLVITIDIDVSRALKALAEVDPELEGIVVIEGDVRDPELPARVAEHIPADAQVLLVEDSQHTYETTAAALRGFADFVPVGGFLVVEDGHGNVPITRPPKDIPWGVLPALDDWLATEAGSRFEVHRELERYGVTTNPRGYLQRVR